MYYIILGSMFGNIELGYQESTSTHPIGKSISLSGSPVGAKSPPVHLILSPLLKKLPLATSPKHPSYDRGPCGDSEQADCKGFGKYMGFEVDNPT